MRGLATVITAGIGKVTRSGNGCARGPAVLELEQELGAGDDFPAFVSGRVVAGVQHALVAMAFGCRGAALYELREDDRADRVRDLPVSVMPLPNWMTRSSLM